MLQFLLLPKPPLLFTAGRYGGLIFLALETWAGRSGLGLGSCTPKVSLLIFIHHT